LLPAKATRRNPFNHVAADQKKRPLRLAGPSFTHCCCNGGGALGRYHAVSMMLSEAGIHPLGGGHRSGPSLCVLLPSSPLKAGGRTATVLERIDPPMSVGWDARIPDAFVKGELGPRTHQPGERQLACWAARLDSSARDFSVSLAFIEGSIEATQLHDRLG